MFNCENNCTCPDNAKDGCEKNSGNCTCILGKTGENCNESKQCYIEYPIIRRNTNDHTCTATHKCTATHTCTAIHTWTATHTCTAPHTCTATHTYEKFGVLRIDLPKKSYKVLISDNKEKHQR
jgi:hypothetical protein